MAKSCFDFFHPEDIKHMKNSFEEVLKLKGQVLSVQYRFRSKGGGVGVAAHHRLRLPQPLH